MSLEEYRERINGIDAEIVRLLNDRARVSRAIGVCKRRDASPVYQPDREREVIRRIQSLSEGGIPPQSLANIYHTIMAESVAMQKAISREASAAPCRGHGKVDTTAEVVENVEAAPGFFRMRLVFASCIPVFAPGQFFQLRIGVEGEGGFLRRPFAPSAVEEDGFSFIYAVVGEGTRRMSRLERGMNVGILAPLGTGYSLPESLRSALLVGGGCGAPSLAPLARHLRRNGVNTTVLLGARTAAVLLEHETFAAVSDRLIVATDDGSSGCQGTVVDACRVEGVLDSIDAVFSCGPAPMLRAVCAMASEMGIPCQVSLEERMACGFGACMGCVVPVRVEGGSTFRRVCHDGPVFDAATLAWDEI